ncbi:reverse transcriptase [Gossypium australe]|uniref:Reverse transcriptase n=1 Tax=Gossypium australe TaxID=47621 RepID=A0A5B6UZX8_9ROSI|nr:reverse transcriptase [Gossypium australe]
MVLFKTIMPERGLQQGDPVSPYLFFYIEAFSKMGIRASINGPRINHLFFTNDAFLFVRNKKGEAKTVLKDFTKALGQDINFDKSMIMFSPNTPFDQQQHYSDLFGMKVVNMLDNYLGLPLPVGEKKTVAFQSVINRFYARLPVGQRNFSPMAVSLMTCNPRLAERGGLVTSEAESLLPERHGGLGFCGLYLFNVALLGRQVWRHIHVKNILCYQVLSSKYFFGDFHPKDVD